MMADKFMCMNFQKSLLQSAQIFKINVRNSKKVNYKPQKQVKSSEEVKILKYKKIEQITDSIKPRGFLRNIKEYKPPSNAYEKLYGLCSALLGTTDPNFILADQHKRCMLLYQCQREFDYKVPNSILHTIKTIRDLEEFYSTAISTTTPLDAFKDLDLPPNLHVQFEYHRFHPDTDTMFKGITAFPRSSTLICSLRNKNKYKGHKQELPWDDI